VLAMSSSSDNNSNNFDSSSLRIMVNGMPGPMATAAAEACLRKGLSLAPVAMTGPAIEPTTITVKDAVTGRSSDVRLIPATDDGREEIVSALAGIRAAVGQNNVLAIDYTHPSAVNDNAIFYAEHSLPFVMGTTGGDRDKLLSDVVSRCAFAVIAPNMGKQIVAMQAGLEDMAHKFPGAFAGYTLQVTESHQSTKADTSGTAKAVIGSLNKLSDDTFDVEKDVVMLRDDESSLAFGVSKEALKGHAFHTYTLTSPDGSVQFALQHNVEGRTVYAEGTADAVKFLASKVASGMEGQVFSMIDVLQAGALE
jgi:4-hydroxy-tetrahydrodipicolinate reductase